MGLNDIVLTGASLADLYASSLVDTGDVTPAATKTTPVTSGQQAVMDDPAAAKTTPVTSGQQAVMADPAAKKTLAIIGETPVMDVPPAAIKVPVTTGQPTVMTTTSAAMKAPVTTGQSPSASTPAARSWKFLGNNKKRVLVVVDYEGAAYLPDEELAFLTRMLMACKLGLDDVAIVNSAHYPGALSADYLKEFRSTQVLLFDRDPETFGLPISFPHFQVQSFAGVTFLSSPALGGMIENVALKTSLWVSLKRIFSL